MTEGESEREREYRDLRMTAARKSAKLPSIEPASSPGDQRLPGVSVVEDGYGQAPHALPRDAPVRSRPQLLHHAVLRLTRQDSDLPQTCLPQKRVRVCESGV